MLPTGNFEIITVFTRLSAAALLKNFSSSNAGAALFKNHNGSTELRIAKVLERKRAKWGSNEIHPLIQTEKHCNTAEDLE